MADIDVGALATNMGAAALGALKEKWPLVRGYAEGEFRKLGETAVMIQKGMAAGEINEAQARILMDMQKHAMRSVLLTIEGLGSLAVEEAINAALEVARGTINAAVKFALL